MVTYLINVQHVKLRMPLYMSMCRDLYTLEKLKSIVWVADVIGHDIHGAYGLERRIAEAVFDCACIKFAEKPVVEIIAEDDVYCDVHNFDCFEGCDLGGVEARPTVGGTGQVPDFEV